MKANKTKLKALVVAAYNKELAALCTLGRKHFIIKEGIAYLSAGIGPTAATFGLTHFLEDHAPDLIISVGTAGIINPKSLKIGHIILAKACGTCSGDANTYSLKTMQNINLNTKSIPVKLRLKLNNIHRVSVFSPQEISRTEDRKQNLIKMGYDAENLENYSFAYVAKKFRIPLVSLLGFTNYVGKDAHKEWKKNEGRLCLALGKAVCGLLP